VSGTSVDGVDAALVRVLGSGLDLRADLAGFCTQPFPDDLRRAILRAAKAEVTSVDELSAVHARLGHAYADAVRRVTRAAGHRLDELLVVASSGQTAWHAPRSRPPHTLQLGAAPLVAEQTGVTVVSDFRYADLAAGGQGAPLVALVDWLRLGDPVRSRLAVNLGGIVNVTYLPAGCRRDEVVAFDVGPGNVLLDALVDTLTEGRDRFDPGGRYAVQGRQLKPLLRHWAAHPYFEQPPPKTTGREEFGAPFVADSLRLAAKKGWAVRDMLCTASQFVADCLADAVARFLPSQPPLDDLVVGGGGVHNGFLIRLIGERFTGVPIRHSDEFGLPVDAKEAIAFAILASLTLDGIAGNVPSATGAQGPRILGTLTPGSPANWRRVVEWLHAGVGKTTARSSQSSR
jgi:anhydro-N-acetylmuramic acid kinase